MKVRSRAVQLGRAPRRTTAPRPTASLRRRIAWALSGRCAQGSPQRSPESGHGREARSRCARSSNTRTIRHGCVLSCFHSRPRCMEAGMSMPRPTSERSSPPLPSGYRRKRQRRERSTRLGACARPRRADPRLCVCRAAATGLAGVTTTSGGDFTIPLDASPTQVPILRTDGCFPVGYIQKLGLGKVVVLADPLVLCNGYLDKADNGRFLSDLLGLVGTGTAVGFDDYHHGLIISDFASQAWVPTPWGGAILWFLVAAFAGLPLRCRRFGGLVPRPAW